MIMPVRKDLSKSIQWMYVSKKWTKSAEFVALVDTKICSDS